MSEKELFIEWLNSHPPGLYDVFLSYNDNLFLLRPMDSGETFDSYPLPSSNWAYTFAADLAERLWSNGGYSSIDDMLGELS